MKWSIVLATTTIAATMLMSLPASAVSQCPKQRTIVVGKGETQALTKKQCKHKFIKKGLETFGQKYVLVDKIMSCEEIGNPKGGNDLLAVHLFGLYMQNIFRLNKTPTSTGSRKSSIPIPECYAYRTARLERAGLPLHRSACPAWGRRFDEQSGSQS